jgi:hypothetical protein
VVVSRGKLPRPPLLQGVESTVEVNSWSHKVLDPRADPKPEANPTPLQEGFASARVSMLGLVLVAYAILFFHRTHAHAQGLEDAVRWEAKHAFNEKAQAQSEWEPAQKATHRAVKCRWVHTPQIWVLC